ncbi:MAG: hypothetical protein OEV95_00095 [Gemmatimonadota bacterium]|nr:hypothetical protein [Gemmatimonadota bacterium]MDH5283294.1 hypothetical protein [Gemmatimonadota bacterium]
MRESLGELHGANPQSLSVIVIRADTLYVVSDPEFQPAGEWKGVYSFNGSFAFLAAMDW